MLYTKCVKAIELIEEKKQAHLSQKGREGAPPQREPHSFKKVLINYVEKEIRKIGVSE
jgi:hypothetical protein